MNENINDNFEVRKYTLGQLLNDTAAKYPNQEAIVYADRDYRQTWKEFNESVDNLAKGLMALGVDHGEKLALWATNVPHWVTLMFATAKIGVILITVNTSYRDSEVEYLFSQSETENIFVIDGYRDHDYLETIYKIIPELKTQERGKLKCERLPHLKRVMFLGMEKHRGMYSLPEIMAMSAVISDEEYEARQAMVRAEDVVNMQYTSGTTGFPKGVMLTHIGIGNNGYWIGKNQNFSGKDRLCLPVPLFHCFGCVLGVMACINHGVTMVILENFSPLHVMSSVDQEKCTAVYGVPTMYLSIVEHKMFNKFDYSSLRTGIMSGAVCPEPLMRRVIDEMGMKEITIPYGLTEGSPVMTMTNINDTLEHRCVTVGKHMPGIEVVITDPETDEEVPRGTQGEVCCRGYNVMKGYYKREEETKAAIDEKGYLHSGDLGVMDEEGYVRITGRIKDMIIRGGENIYPREIEEFLLKIEGVSDAQVVALKSKKYGEEALAFVILKEGYEHIRAEDIKDACRTHIAWHKIPSYIEFIKAYPLTASGKIQKYKLREEAQRLYPNA